MPPRDAEVAAGDRLRRDRHRVRELLRHLGAEVTGGRGARPRPPGRGRGDLRLRAQAVREAGDEDPRARRSRRSTAAQRQGDRTIEAGGQTAEIEVERVVLAIGIVGNVENLGLEETGVKVDAGPRRGRRVAAAPASPGSTPSATSPAALARAQGDARGRDLRRAGSRGLNAVHPRWQHPRLHLLQAAGRERRPDREGGQGARPRGQGRPVPLHRQRQGDRARRARGAWSRPCSTPRPASCSAPHDRRRGDRADPGLRDRPPDGRPRRS